MRKLAFNSNNIPICPARRKQSVLSHSFLVLLDRKKFGAHFYWPVMIYFTHESSSLRGSLRLPKKCENINTVIGIT